MVSSRQKGIRAERQIIEILSREKFLFGKEGETTYIIKQDGQN